MVNALTGVTSFKEDLIRAIIYMLHYRLFDENLLKKLVRDQAISLPKNTWKELMSVIKKYKK